ncbi:MAG: ABC transporter substrate-binding protein [Castellaniella sp.]
MKLLPKLLAAAAGLTLASSCFSFELQHADGTLNLEQQPRRIVSFDLGHLDTLNTLGIDVVGVPRSVYSGTLARFSDAPVMGTLFEPDYAALAQQAPDLIIAGRRSLPAMPRLGAMAPTVSFAHDDAHFMRSVEASVTAIGQAWERQAQAQSALDALTQAVDALRTINRGKTGALLFIINDHVIPHAPGDRFGYVHEFSGLAPVLPARQPGELGQPRPGAGTPEAEAAARKRADEVAAIAAADPDWLVILDRGAINDGEKTAAATLARHPVLSRTRAVREGKVYYADPNAWYVVTGGVSNLTAIARDMATAMQD